MVSNPPLLSALNLLAKSSILISSLATMATMAKEVYLCSAGSVIIYKASTIYVYYLPRARKLKSAYSTSKTDIEMWKSPSMKFERTLVQFPNIQPNLLQAIYGFGIFVYYCSTLIYFHFIILKKTPAN
uniref:Uncharacterized protein n=1 Tax=Glossina austeni TaxID=7395 RepID=A0A1A9UGL8_GLOAU